MSFGRETRGTERESAWYNQTPGQAWKPPDEAAWMAQQRREEYRVAPLVAPIVKDVESQKGIAESLASVRTVPLMQQLGFGPPLVGTALESPGIIKSSQFMVTGEKQVLRPFASAAGTLIAPAERFAYSYMRLAGMKTPLPPPTLLGGAIGKGVGLITGSPSDEWERAMAYGPDYAFGTLVGDLLLSYGIGKLAEPLTSRISGFIQGKGSAWLTESYEKAARVNELWEPSLTERIVMKVIGARPHLAYGEVGITTWETWGPKGAETIPGGIPYSKMSWELTEAPRMGGVMLSKVPSLAEETAISTIPSSIAKLLTTSELEGLKQLVFESGKEQPLGFTGGKEAVTRPYEAVQQIGSFTKVPYTMGFSSTYGFEKQLLPPKNILDLMREQKLLPFTTQTQVTRMGIFPYQATAHIGDVASKASSLVMGVGVGLTNLPQAIGSMLPKLAKNKAVGLEDVALSLPRLRLDVMTQQKQKERTLTLTMPDISERLSEVQIPKMFESQASREKLVQVQVPKLLLKLDMPTPTLTIPKFAGLVFPSLSGGSDFSREGKKYRGAWFKRSHAIPTWKQMAKRWGIWERGR